MSALMAVVPPASVLKASTPVMAPPRVVVPLLLRLRSKPAPVTPARLMAAVPLVSVRLLPNVKARAVMALLLPARPIVNWPNALNLVSRA